MKKLDPFPYETNVRVKDRALLQLAINIYAELRRMGHDHKTAFERAILWVIKLSE